MRLNSTVRYALLFLTVICVAVGQQAFAQFSKATVLLTGTVTDAESNEPLHARVSFLDQSGAEVNKVMTNSEGKYSAVLHPGTTYGVKLVASKRYVGNESITFEASDKFQQSSRNFTVKPIHTGTVLLSAVSFDHGSATPRAASESAAIAAGKAMKLNEEIEVTIETWSDDGSNGAVPADQGTQRANALKNILVANGAPAKRIVLNPHNPPPAAPVKEEATGKGKKKAKAVKKPKPAKKPVKGKKGAVVETPGSKATIIITKLYSEDD